MFGRQLGKVGGRMAREHMAGHWWHREAKKQTKDGCPSTPDSRTSTKEGFSNRMSKARAVAKLRSSLPASPAKRISVMKTYLTTTKASPTPRKLVDMFITNTPKTHKQHIANEAIMKDVRGS